MSSGPVETKVKAGAGAAVVGGLIVWTLKEYVFGGEVPEPVVAFIFLAVPAVASFFGGYVARHTFRHDPDAINTQERPPTA